jgi:hypothetical protein
MNPLLLDDKILETYGISSECLYSEEKTKEWLENSEDKGLMYYTLENRLNSVMYNKINEEINEYDKWFYVFIKSFLADEHVQVFEEILCYFQDFIKPKTRIAKLKYSEIQDKIFMLSNSYYIPVNKYISIRHTLKIQDDISNIDEVKIIDFNTNLRNLEILVEKSRSEALFISNKSKYLSNSVYNFNIENYKQYIQHNREIHHEYTKLWSKLSNSERENRIKLYVYNNITIDESEVQGYINAYNNKEIMYNNIKWNQKYGEIDNINNIIDGKVQVKKKQITKKVYDNQDNEKIINEILLFKLISSDNKISYDEILNHVTDELKCKLHFTDKKIIKNRYKLIQDTINETLATI